MPNTYPPIDIAFKVFTKMAMDNSITIESLSYNIFNYIKEIGYYRSPYEMKFEGFKRARIGTFNSIEEACVAYNHVKELSYPPAKFVNTNSRCNGVNESVFYCSVDNGVAIFEVRPTVGQFIALATFTPKNNSVLEILLPIIGVKKLIEVLSKRDKNHPMVDMLKGDFLYQNNRHIPNFDEIAEFDERLSGWFTQTVNQDNKYIYKLTTAFYKGFMNFVSYENTKIKGLIYPSVAGDFTGFNIAFETSIADNELMVDKRTTIYKLEDFKDRTFHLRPIKQIKSIDNYGNIEWENADWNNIIWPLKPSDPTVMINAF